MSTEEIDETVGELRISQKVEGHFNQGPQASTRDFSTLTFSTMNSCYRDLGHGSRGYQGSQWHPQLLEDQLTMFQKGEGQILPTTLLMPTQFFFTFRHPCFNPRLLCLFVTEEILYSITAVSNQGS